MLIIYVCIAEICVIAAILVKNGQVFCFILQLGYFFLSLQQEL